jgi:hypothetical protein
MKQERAIENFLTMNGIIMDVRFVALDLVRERYVYRVHFKRTNGVPTRISFRTFTGVGWNKYIYNLEAVNELLQSKGLKEVNSLQELRKFRIGYMTVLNPDNRIEPSKTQIIAAAIVDIYGVYSQFDKYEDYCVAMGYSVDNYDALREWNEMRELYNAFHYFFTAQELRTLRKIVEE